MRRLFALVITASLAVAHAATAADARPMADAIVAKGPCLTSKLLAAQVSSWLGRDDLDTRLRVLVVETEGPPRKVSFVIQRSGVAVGERRFEDLRVSCDETVAVVALAIAVSLDHTLLYDMDVAPVPRDLPRRTVPPRSSVGVELGGAAFVAAGALPTTVVGFTPSSHIHMGAFRFGARFLFGRGLDIDVGPGQLESNLVGGAIDLCLRRGRANVVFAGCFSVLGAGARASGKGFTPAETTVVGWVASSIGGTVDVVLVAPLRLSLGAEVFVSFLRPRFEVREADGTVAYEAIASPVGFLGSLGLSLSFE